MFLRKYKAAVFNIDIFILFCFYFICNIIKKQIEQQIIIISEGSCNTRDWSNNDENVWS